MDKRLFLRYHLERVHLSNEDCEEMAHLLLESRFVHFVFVHELDGSVYYGSFRWTLGSIRGAVHIVIGSNSVSIHCQFGTSKEHVHNLVEFHRAFENCFESFKVSGISWLCSQMLSACQSLPSSKLKCH